MGRLARASMAGALFFSLGSPVLGQTLINGGFEQPAFSGTGVTLPLDSAVDGWSTTAADRRMEFWYGNFQGVVPYEGRQFVELNANLVSSLYQDVSSVPAGGVVGFGFAHRGRLGVDTLRLTITDLGPDNVPGGGNDSVLFSSLYSDGNTAWGFKTSAGLPPIVTLGNTLRFAFISVSAAGSSQSVGNFLDAVQFGLGVNPVVPEASTWGAMVAAFTFVGANLWRRFRHRGQPPTNK